MAIPSDLLRLGYWPSLQLSGAVPFAICSADEYASGDVLNIACTQTGLPASHQRRIVAEWVRRLPSVSARTILFSSKVPQALFDAACAAPELQALSVKWSACRSIAQLQRARGLEALFIGSSPGVTDLSPLSELHSLRHLFIENVGAPVDLSPIHGLRELREFGLSAARGHRLPVQTLEPLSALQSLEMLWLVSLEIQQGGLRPLYGLQQLRSLRTTIGATSAEFKDLCAAVPSLQFFQAVG